MYTALCCKNGSSFGVHTIRNKGINCGWKQQTILAVTLLAGRHRNPITNLNFLPLLRILRPQKDPGRGQFLHVALRVQSGRGHVVIVRNVDVIVGERHVVPHNAGGKTTRLHSCLATCTYHDAPRPPPHSIALLLLQVKLSPSLPAPPLILMYGL